MTGVGRHAIRPFLGVALTVIGSARGGVADDRPSRPEPRAYLDLPRVESGPMPPLLSRTGAFRETRGLTPADGLIAYDLNASFWSDGAVKTRWISLPGRVGFSAAGAWAFPEGTVFVKHFELPADETRPEVKRRLETRLLVVGPAGGVYGASYRWRGDHSDADLVAEARREPVEVRTASGTRSQVWYYPGPTDCRQCHNAASGGVLGVNTRQLNREPDGSPENPLRVWNRLGLFEPPLDESAIPRLARLARLNDPRRSLEDRARSYLDANCAQCHRPGGVVADFDARYETPLAGQRLIGEPVRINLGVDGARFVAPNDRWRSAVLTRVDTWEPSRMPPLGRETVDREAVAVLRAWIESLPGPPVVSPPTILPGGGDYSGPVRVSIAHDDPAAVVRYTLDGTAPRESSPAYAGPFEVRRSTTVRARAYRPGHTRSIATQETLIIAD